MFDTSNFKKEGKGESFQKYVYQSESKWKQGHSSDTGVKESDTHTPYMNFQIKANLQVNFKKDEQLLR